jgi:sugar lactone lactonase YvrE
MASRAPAELAFRHDARLGEGAAWDSRAGRLLWVDIERGELHGLDLTNASDTLVARLPEPSAVRCRRLGGFIVGFRDGVALLDAQGACDSVVPIQHRRPSCRMNDAGVDPFGGFWIGSMDTSGARDGGVLYRIGSDLSVAAVRAPGSISHGIAWDPSGSLMYYVDSPTRRIDVLDVDASTRQVAHRRPFARIDPADGFPDGIAVDAEGCVWVACWDGWSVRAFDRSGAAVTRVELPVARPTSCAFGGRSLDRLFITTARTGLPDAKLAGQELAGSIFVADVGVRGLEPATFIETSRS